MCILSACIPDADAQRAHQLLMRKLIMHKGQSIQISFQLFKKMLKYLKQQKI